MNSMEKTAVIGFVVLAAVAGVASFAFLTTYMSLSTLRIQYGTLSDEYDELSSDYDDLSDDYDALQAAHSSLQTDYNALQMQYNDLDINYDDLTNAYNSYVSAYQSIVSDVNLYSFHPSEAEKSLITWDDPDVADVVWDITHGWSDTLDWDEYWADVKAMYDWVVNNIEYSYDQYYPILPDDPRDGVTFFDEVWQTPAQTLELGEGDCEDMAILLCSMVLNYNDNDYWVEVIAITGHAAVYLPVVNDQICILDPTGQYYTNNGAPFFAITQKDTTTEVNAWLHQWDIWAPEDAPHQIDWIFSNDIWQEFNSNIEFIDWLNGRE